MISSLGIGTTLSLSSLLTGLMQVASIPLTTYQANKDSVNTEISAYGTLSSALTTFQTAISNLTLSANFKSLAASSSNTSVATASVYTGASAGSYTVAVSQLAQAQTLVASGQSSLSTAIGGNTSTTLTFDFGTVSTTTGTDADGNATSSSSFTSAGTTKTLTIDSTNNTLAGIRDAINGASLGVTASIVNDGSDTPYRLVITSNTTGAASGLKISASGDSTVAGMLAYDPASTGSQGMTQTVAAQDAKLTVNGLSLSSATNTVSGSLPGFTLSLAQTGSTTLTVSNDTDTIATNIATFVDAYNTLLTSINTLTNYDANDSSKNGALLGDSTVNNIKSLLQRIATSSIDGGGTLKTLADVGISYGSDGSLSLDATTLKSKLSSNLSDFAALFGTAGTTTDARVSYLAAGSSTQAGTYKIDITRAATQASASGTAAANLTSASSSKISLTVALNGATVNISIPQATYTSADELAKAVQTAINDDSTFKTAGSAVNVSANSDGTLTIGSTAYGSASKLTVTGLSASALFGTSSLSATDGVDVAGTIGGFQATGSGQTLTGQTGTAVAGLAVEVSGDTTGERGTVSYSVGFAAQFYSYVADVTSTSGAIATATGTLDDKVTAITTQMTKFQAHLDQVQAKYEAQFTALNALLTKMKTASSLLDAQFNSTTSS
ncbi:flagellar filament capping protein FliD [Chitinasiproducens palmae]|uniref:flagellar filament capping protein FliD n=1 Tax=Chitinasiproducens palmae TaxID=1770053 RepID=UPI00147C3E85|nr:flagellar filament capping protein FliD [Chitinasiproducens palmae]